ncbi:MAG: hypothetical protein ACKV19_23535 [Verrucomicrobiales bacterium]
MKTSPSSARPASLVCRESNQSPPARVCSIVPFYEHFAAADRACLSGNGTNNQSVRTVIDTRARQRLLLTGFVLAMGSVLIPTAQAASYSVEKKVEWDISTTDALGNVTDVRGPQTGSYTTAYHIFAMDAHVPKDVVTHLDNKGGGLPIPIPPLATAVEVNKVKGMVTFTPHASYDPPTFFDQAAKGIVDAVGDMVNSKHPASTARVTVVAFPPVNHIVKSCIAFSGSAVVAPIPLPKDNKGLGETAYAESFGAAQLRLTGLVKKADVFAGRAFPKSITVTNETLSLRSGLGEGSEANLNSAGKYDDPISLSIIDSVTGVLVAQQDLWNEGFTVDGGGSILWNDTDGLVLSAGLGGFAEASFETLGSWVTNPFTGTASISNGIFTATGGLEILPWQLSTIDGETFASLSVLDFSQSFTLQVEADGLGVPINDLRLELNNEGEASARDYATVDATPNVPDHTSTLWCLSGGMALCLAGFHFRRSKAV